MTPEELTTEQVREELKEIILQYPNRTGRSPSETNEGDCVYYLDGAGHPVDETFHNEDDMDYSNVLVTPVCIVGQWIESFHPEYKENLGIQTVLVKNRLIQHSCCTPLKEEVLILLGNAQRTQDGLGKTWRDIEL